jgi:hypothetical protein
MAIAPGPQGPNRDSGDTDMTRTYVTVIAVWAVVLAALFAFQQAFTY